MLEMKITIAAPDLAAAISNLATAMRENMRTICNQYGKNNCQIENVGAFNMSSECTPAEKAKSESHDPNAVTQSNVEPATMPSTATPAPGVPLSEMPAKTAVPVAHTVPVAPQVAQPVPTATPVANPVPTAALQYTLDMIATAGSALIDAGKMDQLLQLLAKFGVASLTELSPSNYGAVASELRALGAAI